MWDYTTLFVLFTTYWIIGSDDNRNFDSRLQQLNTPPVVQWNINKINFYSVTREENVSCGAKISKEKKNVYSKMSLYITGKYSSF